MNCWQYFIRFMWFLKYSHIPLTHTAVSGILACNSVVGMHVLNNRQQTVRSNLLTIATLYAAVDLIATKKFNHMLDKFTMSTR